MNNFKKKPCPRAPCCCWWLRNSAEGRCRLQGWRQRQRHVLRAAAAAAAGCWWGDGEAGGTATSVAADADVINIDRTA